MFAVNLHFAIQNVKLVCIESTYRNFGHCYRALRCVIVEDGVWIKDGANLF